MADRPLGVDPPGREFSVGRFIDVRPLTRRERIAERIYHFKKFTIRRSSTIELDIEDDLLNDLVRFGWLRKYGDDYFFTKKGSDVLCSFAREELTKLREEKSDRRREG